MAPQQPAALPDNPTTLTTPWTFITQPGQPPSVFLFYNLFLPMVGH